MTLRDIAFELAKQSSMNDDISHYLRKQNIQIEYPNPSEIYVTRIQKHLENIQYQSLELDYRLIPGLRNLKNDQLLRDIFVDDEIDVLEMIYKIDSIENRKRTYDISKFCRSVVKGMIEPPLLLCQIGKLSVIEGRSRLLVAYKSKITIKVNLLVDLSF